MRIKWDCIFGPESYEIDNNDQGEKFINSIKYQRRVGMKMFCERAKCKTLEKNVKRGKNWKRKKKKLSVQNNVLFGTALHKFNWIFKLNGCIYRKFTIFTDYQRQSKKNDEKSERPKKLHVLNVISKKRTRKLKEARKLANKQKTKKNHIHISQPHKQWSCTATKTRTVANKWRMYVWDEDFFYDYCRQTIIVRQLHRI